MFFKTRYLFLLLIIVPNPLHTFEINNNNNNNNNKNDIYFLEKMMVALFKLLNCIKNTKQIDANLSFGIAMAAGQLKVAMKYLDTSTSNVIYQILHQMEDLCLNMLNSANSSNSEDLLFKILTPSLWEIDQPQKQLLPSEGTWENDAVSSQAKDEVENPTKEESDFCLRLLLKNCNSSSKCLKDESTDENSGYSLTHQVLYWQLFRQVNCKRDVQLINIETVIRNKCKRILDEIMINLQSGTSSVNEDLLLEQVSLCSMENYEEFLVSDFKNIILELQITNGCFELNKLLSRQYGEKDLKRFNNHISAVATLALAVQIKALLTKITYH